MPAMPRLVTSALDELFHAPVQREWAEAAAGGWGVEEPSAYCHRCGATIGKGAVTEEGCGRCIDSNLHWRRAVRLGPYRDPLRRWVWSLKYHGQWRWADRLGATLAESVRACEVRADGVTRWAVCPVPMHALRRWNRGYNQAALLADAVARTAGWPCVPLLRRNRYRRSQTTVPASKRPANVRGSFAANPIDLTGWGVWLVDDVKTTGATLSACARLLKESGAAWIGVAVVAVAEPHEHAR
ncbi:MAG: ComF family protein [Planctomycetes bacterium]|nr:ComF family protein [Planctomycetota bacterium]